MRIGRTGAFTGNCLSSSRSGSTKLTALSWDFGDILLDSALVKTATCAAAAIVATGQLVRDRRDVDRRAKVCGDAVFDCGASKEWTGLGVWAVQGHAAVFGVDVRVLDSGLNPGIQIPRQLLDHSRCENMQHAPQVKQTRERQLAADSQRKKSGHQLISWYQACIRSLQPKRARRRRWRQSHPRAAGLGLASIGMLCACRE